MAFKFICCGHCACCNDKVFERWFGYNPRKGETAPGLKRRSHEQVVLETRKKKEAIAHRRELNKRLRLEREARRQAKENKP